MIHKKIEIIARGMEAVDTGSPITVPVGEKCLGRIFNLLGEPVDNQPAPQHSSSVVCL